MTMLIGSDGSATFSGDGFGAKLNTFSATLTRTTQIVTGFGDTSQRRRASGVLDITGSAGGTPIKDEANASPLGITGTLGGVGASSSALVLKFAGSDDCTLGFDAIVNSVAFAVTQDGAQTVTFNFEMDDANGPDVAWDES
tara:strand:+ start:2943 stop:3365 length:423 start_codon:yes stop_codon:yes gene_type:complete